MSILDNSEYLNWKGLSFMPIRKHRRSKPHSNYYQTECVHCNLIISVKWEQKYIGTLPTHARIKPQPRCPFCNGTQLHTIKINKKQYIDINRNWDIVDSTQKKDEEMADWLSWIHCET